LKHWPIWLVLALVFGSLTALAVGTVLALTTRVAWQQSLVASRAAGEADIAAIERELTDNLNAARRQAQFIGTYILLGRGGE